MTRPKNKLIRPRLGKPKDIDLGRLPKEWGSTVYGEPKKDGLRGIIVLSQGKAKAYTSNGLPVVNARYICRAIEKGIGMTWDLVLDGEFFYKDWNMSNSLVMTQQKHPQARKLVLTTFDFIPYSKWINKLPTESLRCRKKQLRTFVKKINSRNVQYLKHTKLKRNELLAFFSKMKKAGHEGAMYKDPKASYPYKRSNAWLRLKPKSTDDCKVIGMKPGNGKFKGLIGSLKCSFRKNGKKITFNCSGMDDTLRKQLTKLHKSKSLIGKIVEVEHEGITVKDKLRFPQFKRLREDKE